MEEETLSEVLYQTVHHSSGRCFPNYPPQKVNDTANTGVLSLLSTRGLTRLKEKLIAQTQPKKSKRLVSLFVSPKGERVAVADGNHITILRKDDDYQQPYGAFTSNDVDAFVHGVWSESHDVLGIVDSMDTLYFIKSNGEELLRIERKHLRVTLPLVGLFVPAVTETRRSVLCNFNFLTTDGTLHDIEISQDLNYNVEHSLLVLIGGPTNISLTTSSSTGSYTLSVWHWGQNIDLQQIISLQFEGMFSKPKGFRGLAVSPKVLISPHGKFIGTLDLRAHLNIFELNVDCSSVSLFAYGETESVFLEDIVDFTWWSDHVCTIAKKGGTATMFDVLSGKRLLDNDPMFSLPVLERANYFSGKVFVLDIPLPKERQNTSADLENIYDIEQYIEGNMNQVELSRLSWRLLSLSERSIPEMYDSLINNNDYQSALDFADRYKLDKDQVFKSQWLHSAQESDDVDTFLSNVNDEAFVSESVLRELGVPRMQ
ncbi:MAG2-interacting protein 2 [Bienertia sinuspersici]